MGRGVGWQCEKKTKKAYSGGRITILNPIKSINFSATVVMFTCFLTDARTEIHSLNSAGITVAERQSESVGGESEKFQSDIS